MSDTAALRGEHAPGSIPAARRAMLAWIDSAGDAGRSFLQLHLLARADGGYRLRHVVDRLVDGGVLRVVTDPYLARELAQTTGEGAHRPLKTSPDLRSGWSFERLEGRDLWIALDYFYPACATHWYAGSAGSLRVTHWRDTAARQSGIYSAVKLLPEPVVQQAVQACCGDAVCLRQIAWGLSEDSPEPIPADDATAPGLTRIGEASVPCPEACSMFVSFARSVLAVERSPSIAPAGLSALRELELDQIQSLIAAWDAGGTPPRDGEFDDPLNRRRVRYLGARLTALVRETGAESS